VPLTRHFSGDPAKNWMARTCGRRTAHWDFGEETLEDPGVDGRII